MKNVLVLGAHGFIGRHLSELLGGVVNLIGYDRTIDGDAYNATTLQRDFISEAHWGELLKQYRIDTVYHLVSNTLPAVGTTDIVCELEENISPTLRLLEGMRTAGTKRIIFASSGGTVYGESCGQPHSATDVLRPICSYGVQKSVIEQYLQFYTRIYGMQCINARISNPYGVLPQSNRTQGIIPIFLHRLWSNQGISLYGETVRDYIYIDDVVSGLLKLGDYNGEQCIFNIGSGTGVGLHQLVELIEIVAGRRFVEITEHPIRPCDVRENILNIEDTKQQLNWTPQVALEDGIGLTLAALK